VRFLRVNDDERKGDGAECWRIYEPSIKFRGISSRYLLSLARQEDQIAHCSRNNHVSKSIFASDRFAGLPSIALVLILAQ